MRRIAAVLLSGAVVKACTGRGVDEKPEDEEARGACEALCGQSETCDPDNAMPDCMEQCLIGPRGDDNPARWDDPCREETLASVNCQAHLSCEEWLDRLYGEGGDPGGDPYTPARQKCEDLAVDEVVCRQADDS